eukprot:5631623-Alexandrium_andersonii.AAC.1
MPSGWHSRRCAEAGPGVRRRRSARAKASPKPGERRAEEAPVGGPCRQECRAPGPPPMGEG